MVRLAPCRHVRHPGSGRPVRCATARPMTCVGVSLQIRVGGVSPTLLLRQDRGDVNQDG
jgi:hypothetical protein